MLLFFSLDVCRLIGNHIDGAVVQKVLMCYDHNKVTKTALLSRKYLSMLGLAYYKCLLLQQCADAKRR